MVSRQVLIGMLFIVCASSGWLGTANAADSRGGGDWAANLATANSSFGRIELGHRVWMAVIADPSGARVLAGTGDPIFRGKDPQAVGIIQTVTPGSLTIRLSRDGKEVPGFLGRPLPGAPDLTVDDVVAVSNIEYRYRQLPPDTAPLLNGELYFAGMEEECAILKRDVDPAKLAREAQQHLATIPIVEVASHTWEIRAEDLQSGLGASGVVVNRAFQTGQLGLGIGSGLGVEFKTPLADVQLDRKGFLITNPSLAARAGLQVGDRVVAVNESPISGISDALRVYQQIKNTPAIREVRLSLERNAQPITLTYRIR
jgi:hypothetical protein